MLYVEVSLSVSYIACDGGCPLQVFFLLAHHPVLPFSPCQFWNCHPLYPLCLTAGCDQDPSDPLYLPAALELLDAPGHFRVQQLGHYPPANSSLGSRSETFLLLQPWPRAQPLLRASYPPFATQQVRWCGWLRGVLGAPRPSRAPLSQQAEAHTCSRFLLPG